MPAGGMAALRGERCPRCSGMTYVGEDRFGWYRSCLACGWLEDVGDPLSERGMEASLPVVVLGRLLLGGEAPRGGRRRPGGVACRSSS